MLMEKGVPRRKYTAVCRVSLVGGRIIENAIIEEGWIIALDKSHLAGVFEQRIDFDPRTITAVEILQTI